MSDEVDLELDESLCDCAHPDAHDLDCAYLDVLMFQKVAAGDVVIVGEPS